jgi:hypothetical protein
VSYDFIKSRPEATLRYPNAQLVSPFGASEQSPFAGGSSAFMGGVYTTPDPPERVYQWYREWLTANGWQDAELFGLATTQQSAQGYKRGTRERVTVAINKPDSLSATLGRTLPEGGTIFEVRYRIVPANAKTRN